MKQGIFPASSLSTGERLGSFLKLTKKIKLMKPNDSNSQETLNFQMGKNSGNNLSHLILNADISQIHDLLMLRLIGELKEHDRRVSCLEKNQQQLLQNQQILLQRVECVEEERLHIRHIVSRNEELENKVSFYEPPD